MVKQNPYLLELYTYYQGDNQPYMGAVQFLAVLGGVVMMSPLVYASAYDEFVGGTGLRSTLHRCMDSYVALESKIIDPNRTFCGFITAEDVLEFLSHSGYPNAPQLGSLFIRWFV